MHYFLRELRREDLPALNAWRADPALIDKLGSVFRYVSPEVDDKWFNHYMDSRGANIRLAICDMEANIMVGAVYLLNIDWVNRYGELSIWIGHKDARGKGAGLFGMHGMLRHAFQDLNLHRVWLRVLSNNAHAIALYDKVGFVCEGRSREVVFKNGVYVDLVHMSILDTEYASLR